MYFSLHNHFEEEIIQSLKKKLFGTVIDNEEVNTSNTWFQS